MSRISARTRSQLEKQRAASAAQERTSEIRAAEQRVSTPRGAGEAVADGIRALQPNLRTLERAARKPAWLHDQALLDFARRKRDQHAELAAEQLGPDGGLMLDSQEKRKIEHYLDELNSWEQRVSALEDRMERRRTSASVRYEPRVYNRDGEFSFFRDLASVGTETSGEALDAQGRLARHAREVDYELRARERAQTREARDVSFERRANPNRAPGFGGNFAPPLWLIEEFAIAPRPGRVLADLVRQAGNLYPLPDGVQSVNVPRIVQGTIAQQVADVTTVPGQDLTDAPASSPAATISGMVDAALQLLEQSPRGAAALDRVIFKDLAAAYDASLERMLITGSGTGGQFTGLLNVTGINQGTYTDASPTAMAMYAPAAQLAAQIGDARNRPPECWLMRTARWAWLGAAEDADGRPLSLPGHFPSEPLPDLFDDSRPTPVAPLLGWPIYPNDAIPANLGAGTNEDVVIAARPSDYLIWESTPKLSILTEPLSGTMGVRLRMHGYVAAILARQPSGIGVLSGTGLVVQTGW